VVTQSENESVGLGDDLRPRAFESGYRERRRGEQDSVEGAESDAGAAA
jgi:hypothetical protein